MKLKIQSELLYGVICRELALFPAGRKYYSVRDLLDRHRCNRRVLDAVLKRLEQEGRIYRKPYIGIFSNTSEEVAHSRILFACPDYPSEYLQSFGEHLERHVEQSGKLLLRKWFFNPEEDFVSLLEREDVDLVFLIKPARSYTARELIKLLQLSARLVLIDTKLGDLQVNTVSSCSDQGSMLAAQYLIKRGHRRLGIVICEAYTATVRARKLAFITFAQLSGVEVEVIDCEVRNGELPCECAYRKMGAFLEQTANLPDGLFVVSDAGVPGVFRALREREIHVPEQISVIGFDGLKAGAFYHPPLTTVAADLKLIIEDTLARLRQSNLQSEYFHLEFPMTILERASVKDRNIKKKEGMER